MRRRATGDTVLRRFQRPRTGALPISGGRTTHDFREDIMLALHKWLVWGLFAFGATYAAASTAADGCSNRGELDSMYCDANKDMVADVPTGLKKWKNPSTIVFTYTPVGD